MHVIKDKNRNGTNKSGVEYCEYRTYRRGGETGGIECTGRGEGCTSRTYRSGGECSTVHIGRTGGEGETEQVQRAEGEGRTWSTNRTYRREGIEGKGN